MRHMSYVAGAFLLVGVAAFAVPLQQQGAQKSAGQGRLAQPGAKNANEVPLDNWQPKRLPKLPSGVTIQTIQQGDAIFRGKGGCVTCHGPDGFGMPNAGSGLSLGLNFIPIEWNTIDSLVTAGIPENLTRSSIAMPARGASSNLTPDEVKQVAAYVWAIARTSGEPWQGGHRGHPAGAPVGADTTMK
jgi:mono/diheme cytochrome c family protein